MNHIFQNTLLACAVFSAKCLADIYYCANEGTEQFINGVHYKCIRSRWTNVDCTASDGSRVKLHEVITTKGVFQEQCVIENDIPVMKFTNCISNGRKIQFGEKFIVNSFICVCRQFGHNGIQMDIVGCDRNGQEKNFGDQWTEGSHVIKCERDGRSAKFTIMGCVGENGKMVQIGDKTVQGKGGNRYVYKCEQRVEGIWFGPVGCAIASQLSEQELEFNCARYIDGVLVQCISRGLGEFVEIKYGGNLEVKMC